MRTLFRGRRTAPLALTVTALLTAGSLVACSDNSDDSAPAADTKTVTDARGEVEIPADPQRVAAFDNRIFRVLQDWDIDLVSAPVTLIPDTITKYHEDKNIHDTGSHREPNLEELVASDPDLIITGYRYASQYDKMKELLPDVPVLDLSFGQGRRDENGEAEQTQSTEDTLKDITTLIGEVFDKQDQASDLEAKFDEAKDRAKAAYNPEQTVMGLVTSGGDINYAAPSTGRSVGPVFDMVGLTPSYNHDGSSNHQGDDISVEAIAESRPDWIIVLDRDAAVSADEAGYKSAEELIKNSPALKNVPAVQEDHIIYLPSDFYTTEDIEAYTEVLNSVADSFEAAR
ncbi:MAG: ABC transporter substrate-binding protein [Corynebacterium provencense]|jgi:iron complex transport system substrate-binding protein|uniref:siderophore ABC transporter substrate-binding protein n=1 Tax=Corynebacterium provencense TaxID=1737425 RepID=UPI002989B006|nr:ABC transporter substrate-binding protein [Corynebacterium provencense]